MALALRSSLALRPAVRRGVPAVAVRPSKVVPVVAPARRRSDAVRVAASSGGDMDFDQLLNTWAEKFEKVENKPVVIAYIIAAFAAFFTTEWLIHLPALDILLGFPIQVVGVVMTPVLAVRYLVDKKDAGKDLVELVGDVSKLLPGLKK